MDEQISHAVQDVYNALYDLQNILEHMGVSVRSEEPHPGTGELVTPEEDDEDVEEDPEEAPILDAIFENAAVDSGKSDDIDSFWDSVADDVSEDVSNADVLTYEQALQLGLTPEDEE
jgi:hypothetical protein